MISEKGERQFASGRSSGCQACGPILVAVSDVDAQNYLQTALLSQGFSVRLAESGDEVYRILGASDQVSLVLLDQALGREKGIDTIREIRKAHRSLPIVLMTTGVSFSDPRSRLSGDKNLVHLAAPIFYDDLVGVISRLIAQPAKFPESPADHIYFEAPAHAQSLSMRRVSRMIAQAALSDVPVLLRGETGVGKEMLVRQIHSRSSRARAPLVKINCAALPRELVESQLFGHERGAFTGAHRSQPGLFEVADGGTLLLDEIGDMDIRLQAKLLQMLQDQEFHRLGGTAAVRVNVRVIAATHRDLCQAAATNQFRADLYYRLNVVSINIPPLRERKEEILALAEFFLKKRAAPNTVLPEMDAAVRRRLLAYDWPGNIRELENLMRRYLVTQDASIFRNLHPAANPSHRDQDDAQDGGDALGNHSILDFLDQTKRKAQVDAIMGALRGSHWNLKKAAHFLHLDYKQLLYQMKKLRIEGANRRTRSSRDAAVKEMTPQGDAAPLDRCLPVRELSKRLG